MQNNEGFGRLFHSCDEGITLPKRVFGCYKLKKEKVSSPLLFALRSGCSAVDTAFVYNNESDVGKTLNDAGMSPLLITKLWRSHYSFSASEVEGRLNDHMAALGRRVDVWLIHFPGPGRHPSLKQNKPLDWSPAMRVATWKAMVDLQRAKKVRAVGVSNFSVRQMQSLFDGTGEMCWMPFVVVG
jgi:diketogulonate reductase-like aldo/keto reductase